MSDLTSKVSLTALYRPLGLTVMLAALQGAPAFAQQVDDAAKSNVAGNSQPGVSSLSGGVSEEARAEMLKQSPAYNVHVMFSKRHGHYLAGVPFSVSRRGDQVVVSGTTEGPWLYLKLPAGRYRISAEIDGAWQSRDIQVAASGPATKVHFVARSE